MSFLDTSSDKWANTKCSTVKHIFSVSVFYTRVAYVKKILKKMRNLTEDILLYVYSSCGMGFKAKQFRRKRLCGFVRKLWNNDELNPSPFFFEIHLKINYSEPQQRKMIIFSIEQGCTNPRRLNSWRRSPVFWAVSKALVSFYPYLRPDFWCGFYICGKFVYPWRMRTYCAAIFLYENEDHYKLRAAEKYSYTYT